MASSGADSPLRAPVPHSAVPSPSATSQGICLVHDHGSGPIEPILVARFSLRQPAGPVAPRKRQSLAERVLVPAGTGSVALRRARSRYISTE